MLLQSVIRAIYPAQCVGCDAQTESEHGLCAACWGATQFIHGICCDTCGAPLIGDGDADTLTCDDCMQLARPWVRGRAALVYAGKGRSLVLALKHGDRTDLAIPAAKWMAQRAQAIIAPDALLVPVPLHWSRLLRRRYNQAALLSAQLARRLGKPHCPDALLRPAKTKPLDGHSKADRFASLSGAITCNPRRAHLIAGRDVVLVDDVMTSGATLGAAASAVSAAGAQTVCIVTLARVVKDT